MVEFFLQDKNKGFFVDELEFFFCCDFIFSGFFVLSRNGFFIIKEKKDIVLWQVCLDFCDLQFIFDDMFYFLNFEELWVIEEIFQVEDKLDWLFEIIGVKSQEVSQIFLDFVYSYFFDLLQNIGILYFGNYLIQWQGGFLIFFCF